MRTGDTLSDLLGDLPGIIALILELIGHGKPPTTAAVEAVKERHPNLFGVGRADEAIFESLRQLVPQEKREMLDLVLCAMRDYEERIFRLTVVAMDCGNEVVEKPVKNPQKGQPATTKENLSWENTEKDLRVKYLEDIADEGLAIAASGAKKMIAAATIVRRMRARRLITRSPAQQAALAAWDSLAKWFKVNLLEFFGVEEFSELTEAMVTRKLEEMVDANPAVLSIDDAGRLHGRPRGVFAHMATIIAKTVRRRNS